MSKFKRDSTLYLSRLPDAVLLRIDVCRGGLCGSRCKITQHCYAAMKNWTNCRLFALPSRRLLAVYNNRTLLYISTLTWETIDYKMVSFDVMDVRITPDGVVHYADKDGALYVIDNRQTLLCKCQTITETLWKAQDAIGQRTTMINNILFVYRHTGRMWRCHMPCRVESYALAKQGRDVYVAGFCPDEKTVSIFEIKTSY